jgi:tetratricopeptide (TPR) repeat protein
MCAFLFPIEVPDPPHGEELSRHDEHLDAILSKRYAAITNPGATDDDFRRTLDLVAPWLFAEICQQQRLRVSFILGKASFGLGAFEAAISYYTRALTLASAEDDGLDMALIFSCRGMAHRAVNELDDAANDFVYAVIYYQQQFDHMNELTAPFQLDLLARLGCFLPFVGRYELAQEFVERGRKLLPLVPHSQITAADLDWGQALIYRAKGRQFDAWQAAASAARMYKEVYSASSASSAIRITWLAADIALDLAETTILAERRILLDEAQERIDIAREWANQAQDENGLLSSQLVQLRLNRLRRRLTSRQRVQMLEEIANDAQRLHDIALRSQAFMAIGDEMAATRRNAHRAVKWYHEAINALEGSQIPGLVDPARRKLWLAGEMRA